MKKFIFQEKNIDLYFIKKKVTSFPDKHKRLDVTWGMSIKHKVKIRFNLFVYIILYTK